MKKFLLFCLFFSSIANANSNMSTKVMNLQSYKAFIADLTIVNSEKGAQFSCSNLSGTGNESNGYYQGEADCTSIQEDGTVLRMNLNVFAVIAMTENSTIYAINKIELSAPK